MTAQPSRNTPFEPPWLRPAKLVDQLLAAVAITHSSDPDLEAFLRAHGVPSEQLPRALHLLTALQLIDQHGQATARWHRYTLGTAGAKLLRRAVADIYASLFTDLPNAKDRSVGNLHRWFARHTNLPTYRVAAATSSFRRLNRAADGHQSDHGVPTRGIQALARPAQQLQPAAWSSYPAAPFAPSKGGPLILALPPGRTGAEYRIIFEAIRDVFYPPTRSTG